ASMARGRGGAVADFNRDGWLDVAVVNRRAPIEVYQNAGGDAQWLSVELRQDAPNTRAVGAFIEVQTSERTQVREITVGGGHAGGQAVPAHFGLGLEDRIRLRVIWPDGTFGAWQEVDAGQILTLQR
ncbi:MAG: ASPIC/UnbV domain-containing protein, partial [Pseudomonadota bacterium]